MSRKRKVKPVEGAAVEPGMVLVFTLDGHAPRTKKTSNRVVRVGGFTRVLPSKAHEEWYAAAARSAGADLRAMTAAGRIPIGRPVRVSATFYRDRNAGDVAGYMQALGDFLERQHVIVDDKHIASWDGTTLAVDRERPRIEVTIEVLDA